MKLFDTLQTGTRALAMRSASAASHSGRVMLCRERWPNRAAH